MEAPLEQRPGEQPCWLRMTAGRCACSRPSPPRDLDSERLPGQGPACQLCRRPLPLHPCRGSALGRQDSPTSHRPAQNVPDLPSHLAGAPMAAVTFGDGRRWKMLLYFRHGGCGGPLSGWPFLGVWLVGGCGPGWGPDTCLSPELFSGMNFTYWR